jgi:tetratricopeptide (TPR) repeat protein
MYFMFFRAAAALIALGAALAPATADDDATCRRASGDDSIMACSRLIARHPRDAAAYFSRGAAWENKGEDERALADYHQAIRLDPMLSAAYVGRGNLYEKRGEHDRAMASYDQALRINPRDAFALTSRGDAYEKRHDHDGAIASYDQAIAFNAKYAPAYRGRGFAYEHKGEWDRAMADFDRAILSDPELPGPYNGRGNIFRVWGDYDRAIAEYDQAIRHDPKYFSAYGNRGHIRAWRGEYSSALADYDQAELLEPKKSAGFIVGFRGEAHSFQGKYDLAMADYDQAIQINPRHAYFYAGRCGTWNGKGQYDRALADCEEAIRLNPKEAVAYSHRGFAYGKKGDFLRAMADLDKAIALVPRLARGSWAISYSNRGAIYELQGDLDRAVADYDAALKLAPGLQEALRNRERAMAAREARKTQPPVTVPPRKPLVVASNRRVALVIGNSHYRAAPVLPNPLRDAAAVAEALREVGFEVDTATDLDRDAMVKALHAFRDKADKADWALVYFAGHGIEIERANYLIPTDAKLTDDRDVKTEAVSAGELLSTVGNARELQLVVLDACRSNPFKDQMRRSAVTRAVDRGLAPPPETRPGTLIVYAAKEGEVAADDAGGANSPFAAALVAELKVPGLEVRRLFDSVRDDVLEATGSRQQPFTYGSLPGKRDFFFVDPK